MIFFVDKEIKFFFNYFSGMIFEFFDWRKVKCILIVVMGINYEKVYFDVFKNFIVWIFFGFIVFGFYL